MVLYSFIKDKQGWYIDLKKTPFSREDLSMICGADTLLDRIAEGREKVSVDATTSFVQGYEHLHRKRILEFGLGGAIYSMDSYEGKELNHRLWLCPVTLWVFLRYPKDIYFKSCK